MTDLLGKESINGDINSDKERLEKQEEERRSLAQKDKVSFSFSWFAIVIRGIVGTVVSSFVFTQANRIEDENTLAQFDLIYNYHLEKINDHMNSLIIEMKNLASLKTYASSLSEKKVDLFLSSFLLKNSYLKDIKWISTPENSHSPTGLEDSKLFLKYDIPKSPALATKGTKFTLILPVQDLNEENGFIASSFELKTFIEELIDKEHFDAMNIYFYSEKSEQVNQLLYFFNAEKNPQEPPSKPQLLKSNMFSSSKKIAIADQEFTIMYKATPAFTAHTWQPAIAAGIGMLITTFIVVTAWILMEIEKRQFSNVLHEGHIQEIEGTIDLLENTQNRLVAQENLASLGGLTAGIAHEIKNPLNFINNFSTLSIDIVKEIRNFLAKYKNMGSPEEREEIYESLTTLQQNINTIHEQGKRADNTIQRMLAHSRGKSGEWVRTDIHKILDEYIAFSFHGMRAKNSNFHVKIEKKFDSNVKEIEVVANDMSRVFLNLLNNAFQAIDEKEKKMGKDFQNPTVTVKTENVGNYLRIRIRDNGIGISDEDKSKIFTPFFTTKPTGLGTGLGLSLSYNIIVREHEGSLTFESNKFEFTEFVITIPLQPTKMREEVSS